MGVLNVTPDSFSDGGMYVRPEVAVERALRMVEEGADIIDVGGESTRPGSKPVAPEEEIGRILPVIRSLAGATDIPISVDTTKAAVADLALSAGASIVNDVSGCSFDDQMPAVVARRGASVILMHMKGTPATMQDDPVYGDLVGEISDTLRRAIGLAERAGIGQIIIDPGIGFGKTMSDNLEILNRLGEFQGLGYPLMVGPSRKSFLGTLTGLPVDRRTDVTSGAVAAAVMNGAAIVRVHDIGPIKRVLAVVDAVRRSGARVST